jgi:hypothetical protein
MSTWTESVVDGKRHERAGWPNAGKDIYDHFASRCHPNVDAICWEEGYVALKSSDRSVEVGENCLHVNFQLRNLFKYIISPTTPRTSVQVPIPQMYTFNFRFFFFISHHTIGTLRAVLFLCRLIRGLMANRDSVRTAGDKGFGLLAGY